MSTSSPSEDATRTAYDAVAREYAKRLADELAGKPLDRGLLAAFAELTSDGPVADIGCGPGHVAAHLAQLGARPIGIDLSPAMIEVARERYPGVDFKVGSMLELPAAQGELRGAVLMYSIIHLSPDARAQAYRELARVVRPGGIVLVAFHVSDAEHAAGDVHQVHEFLDHRVELTHYYLAPEDVLGGLTGAGFAELARLDRKPDPAAEYPSRRCYLLVRRTLDR